MSKETNKNINPLVISYLTLRRTLGILGVAFPVILVAGSMISGHCTEIQNSISSYYHTNMRDVFVGFLCAIALFLFAYKGYDKRDNIVGDLACLFALGVAFFPASVEPPFTECISHEIEKGFTGTLHLISAGLLFLSLAYFSIVLFTRKESEPTKQKKKRNKIYRICGYIIIVSVVLSGLNEKFLEEYLFNLQQYKPVFWLETIALWAFGLSWLTKGNVLFKDINKE